MLLLLMYEADASESHPLPVVHSDEWPLVMYIFSICHVIISFLRCCSFGITRVPMLIRQLKAAAGSEDSSELWARLSDELSEEKQVQLNAVLQVR